MNLPIPDESQTPDDEQTQRSSHCYAVHRDPKFVRAIYVVEHDHAIEYAGNVFGAARSVLRGLQNIVVWMDGNWMGYVDAQGDWVFKTRHHPSA